MTTEPPAPRPSDPPRRTVALPSGPAAYTDEGDGPVFLMVHGLPGSVRDFRWLAPHLVAGARVVRVDLPGFGETPVQTEPDPTPAGRARFVLAVTRALELDRPVAVGHSMGGVVACAAADQAPDVFRALALICTPGLRPHRMYRQLPLPTMDRTLRLPGIGPALAPLVRRMFASAGFRNYPDHELYRAITCVACTTFPEHAAGVRRLEVPTTVAWSGDDPLIEPDIAEELAAACPDGPRLRFADGKHNPQKAHAAEIGRTLLSWLDDL